MSLFQPEVENDLDKARDGSLGQTPTSLHLAQQQNYPDSIVQILD
jgi:hypothetical protein